MTGPIVPHDIFSYTRPDEVAECFDGVTAAGLLGPLWDCVKSYTAPSPEESEEPCHGDDCLADFWGRFTPEQQAALNAIAQANEAQYD